MIAEDVGDSSIGVPNKLSTLEPNYFKYEFEPEEFPTLTQIPIATGASSTTKIWPTYNFRFAKV